MRLPHPEISMSKTNLVGKNTKTYDYKSLRYLQIAFSERPSCTRCENKAKHSTDEDNEEDYVDSGGTDHVEEVKSRTGDEEEPFE